jgi:fucose permease
LGGIGLSGVSLLSGGLTAVVCMILMGFCNALNWPSIWPLAIQGVGRFTKTASALLIMAIAGDALFPIVFAQLNAWFGAQAGIGLLLCLYGLILLYATMGYRKKHWGLSIKPGLEIAQ